MKFRLKILVILEKLMSRQQRIKVCVLVVIFLLVAVGIGKLISDSIRQDNVNFFYSATKMIVEEFDRLEIPYQASCGTLLGATRSKGMIPWDHDVDLVVMQEDVNPKFEELRKRVAERGFHLVIFVNEKDKYNPIMRVIKNHKWRAKGVFVDIFTATKSTQSDEAIQPGEGQWYTIRHDKDTTSWFRPAHWENTRMYDFGPLKLRGPQNAKELLCMWYGENCLTHDENNNKLRTLSPVLPTTEYIPSKKTRRENIESLDKPYIITPPWPGWFGWRF